jgi:hypothetical protein
MFVVSIWYRMRSLIEGDKYIIKASVIDARNKILKELIAYLCGYFILTVIAAYTGYMIQSSDGTIGPLNIFIWIIEGSKYLLDQGMLVLFYLLMKR